MQRVTTITGAAVPIDRADIDTDQIIPAVWMKKTESTGYQDGLFEKWRADPGFVLNQPERAGAVILIGGANFGCGSSREHAVWALRDYGFRAVIAPSFADIHRNNLPNCGLVPVRTEAKVARLLMDASVADPAVQITIDVERGMVSCAAAGVAEEPFDLDESAQYRLVNGLDQIDLTLALDQEITRYESRRPDWMPTCDGAA